MVLPSLGRSAPPFIISKFIFEQYLRHVENLQELVIRSHRKVISEQRSLGLEGRKIRWEMSSASLRSKDPYNHENFIYALSRIDGYINCIQLSGTNWLGLKFHFPFIWMPLEKYQKMFRMTKKMEGKCWNKIVQADGFR